MKTVALEKSNLSACVDKAQRDRVVVLRGRKPVALIVGVEGLDREQLELGSSDSFWRLIEARRQEKTLTRAELERRLKRPPRSRRK
jgi:hypothetical protein